MTTARSAALASFCLLVGAALVVPAARAQRSTPDDWHRRDVRTVAQQKINPRVLSAIYRVSPGSPVEPQGFALRLMVDPKRSAASEPTRATA